MSHTRRNDELRLLIAGVPQLCIPVTIPIISPRVGAESKYPVPLSMTMAGRREVMMRMGSERKRSYTHWITDAVTSHWMGNDFITGKGDRAVIAPPAASGHFAMHATGGRSYDSYSCGKHDMTGRHDSPNDSLHELRRAIGLLSDGDGDRKQREDRCIDRKEGEVQTVLAKHCSSAVHVRRSQAYFQTGSRRTCDPNT